MLDYCRSRPARASQMLAIAASLWNFWYGGGLVREGYRYLREGLELCHDHTIVRAQALYAASFLAIQTGDASAAGEMLTELAALAEKFDDERLRAGHAECVGLAVFFAGDLSGGAELLERALAGYRVAGDALLVFDTLILLAFLLEALTWCHAATDEHERAARLLGCTTAVWRLSGARVGETSPYQAVDQQCVEQARASLGAEAFDKAFAEGARLGFDETIRYALDEKPTQRAHGSARVSEPGGLTRREREIATLVARGMTNKEIASALVIRRRTVETHVENILAKLGLTTRTQVAPWLASHQ